MYRGHPPPRGGYPPYEGRGPPPRPFPPPGSYRDDRTRPRTPYTPGHHEHGHPDPYRRSPPRRRYPSPASGRDRGPEYWPGGPPRDSPPSPPRTTPLDHNLVITVGNEHIGPPGSTSSHHHDRDYPPRSEYKRSRSRGRSRPRSHSRGRSPDRSRAKSRGRSKSRAHSRSWSRSRSRSRSRGRSRRRSYSKAKSSGRSKSRHRSRSVSSSSSSRSNSVDPKEFRERKQFHELETARRRKELEAMLNQPTKSILKKRTDSEDSPSVRSMDSPRVSESSICRVADQLLQAVKGMEPHAVAAMLTQLQSDPRMAQKAGLDAEIKEILALLGGAKPPVKATNDIDDEEQFLYGDSEDPQPGVSEPVRSHLELYGDVTEDSLYGDYPPQKPATSQPYGLPTGASPHLQAPPPTAEADLRYVSRPPLVSDQNITVQVSNTSVPPGTEPLEDSERQALEEYEKIQDLLKTIGLDLGVAEISKMAARTKERLHGNKPPKTPTRRRYSSASSDDSGHSCGRRRRSHSGSSSSSSRSRSRGRGRADSWSSDDSRRKSSAPSTKETKAELAPPTKKEPHPPQTPDPPVPPHAMSIPSYPPSHSMVPPNYPPPGYGQYGNYLSYMHQQWPPMYPPPCMTLPPQTPDEYPPTLPYKQYSSPAPKQLLPPKVSDAEKVGVKLQDRVSEEQNNESQKQKVLEEREKLKQDRDIRMKKKEYLMKELERLRKQQGELLRKKRREKDGHKDPLLQEIGHLQEDVMKQISNLRKEHEAAEKKRNEIEKVALILGLNPSDRPRPPTTSRSTERQEDQPPPQKKKREAQPSPEGRPGGSSTSMKQISSAPPQASSDKPPAPSVTAPPPAQAPPPTPPLELFEYYDAGNHWCKNCNVTSGSMFDFFTHLHSKMHRKTLDPYDRPWASTPTKITKSQPSEEKQTKPAKGSEFMVPVRGFFCLLCKEFYGDAICAEEHVTIHAHNEKYKKQMYENPLYEQRRNLDRQAGLALEAGGKKRKHDDDDKGKEKEDKSKHKKDKKDKKKEEEQDSHKDEKLKVKNEEEAKPSKKGEEVKKPKKQEDEYEDKPKHNKDDKNRHSRDEDEKEKFRRDEEDRRKYSREEEYRHRYRSSDDDRYSNRSKYGPRGDEDKYKYDKYSDSRSKLESKPDKDGSKKSEAAKPTEKPQDNKQSEPPPKPYDPPKIFCGPSPAMRAKLRKQSQEAGKLSPAATAMVASFGKFTWKKKENQLAKEAQKVAAEFMKEDEAAANKTPAPVEDCFAKSVAVAKEIAQKLSAQPSTVRPWASNGANKWKIRPNLPAPAATMKKTTMMGKPAPLNTFLSIRPQTQNTTQSVPESPQKNDSQTLHPSANDPIFPILQTDTFIVPDPPKDKVPKTPTSAANTQTQPVTTTPVTPLPTGPSPARVSTQTSIPAPPMSKPVVNIAPPVTKPVPTALAPAPSAKLQQSTMVKVVSDVAAPGVPENEQTRTVFVKPPPFMNIGDGGSKSEKTLKSNMAAAKAQDLFGIFYSSIGQSGPSSMLKPAIDTRTTTSKGSVTPQQPPKPQPEPQNPPKVQATPQPESNKSQPQTHPESNQSEPRTHSESNKLEPQTPPESKKSEPQTPPESNESQSPSQLESELQITSVWSLNEPEVSPSKSTSQTDLTQTKPSPSQNQTGLPELNQAPQTKPEPQKEPQPDQDTKHLTETSPDPPSEPEPKPGPKTRGKTTPTKKKTAPATTRPVRQTRYQTRRQQQQQQPSPEPEPVSGESSESKDLEESDPGTGSGSQQVEDDVQVIEVTPETLGLPSDMTSLNFDYDFNFE
ncbi:zinc finger protein 318 isoform X5 [Sphaeramia orbicularis]|uniref:zinc finger protein 318 isoform X5 n=1 Tax=Sphaeramia orbicularis TaxID=375764 RepID=UPI00117C179A|nr:zinc finger protein 318 isoform X5 [Sphaeramia orbicularis]